MSSFRINPLYLREALAEIGARAHKKDIRVELAVCHGRCVVGAFLKAGRPTPVAVPNGVAWSILAEVMDSMRLPNRWIHDDLTPFLLQAATASRLVQEGRDAGLLLSINETARVLAHKLSLMTGGSLKRGSDAADAQQLLNVMRGVTEAQIEAIFQRHCPNLGGLSPAARECVVRALAINEAHR